MTVKEGKSTGAVINGVRLDFPGHAANLQAHTYNYMEQMKLEATYLMHVIAFSTTAVVAGRLLAMPFFVPRALTLNGLQVNITTAVPDYVTGTATFTNASDQVTGSGTTFASTHIGAKIQLDADGVDHIVKSVESGTALTLTAAYSATGGSGSYTIRHTIRMGLYNMHTDMSKPGTLLVDSGTADINGTGVKFITNTQSLSKGIYYIVTICGSTPTLKSVTKVSWSPLGLATSLVEWDVVYYKEAEVPYALADPFPSSPASWTIGYGATSIASLD